MQSVRKTEMKQWLTIPVYSVRQNFQGPWKISCKIMHYSCRKMQDSCKKYQFLEWNFLLMKFLQDIPGSWNISTFLKKPFWGTRYFSKFRVFLNTIVDSFWQSIPKQVRRTFRAYSGNCKSDLIQQEEIR